MSFHRDKDFRVFIAGIYFWKKKKEKKIYNSHQERGEINNDINRNVRS